MSLFCLFVCLFVCRVVGSIELSVCLVWFGLVWFGLLGVRLGSLRCISSEVMGFCCWHGTEEGEVSIGACYATV